MLPFKTWFRVWSVNFKPILRSVFEPFSNFRWILTTTSCTEKTSKSLFLSIRSESFIQIYVTFFSWPLVRVDLSHFYFSLVM